MERHSPLECNGPIHHCESSGALIVTLQSNDYPSKRSFVFFTFTNKMPHDRRFDNRHFANSSFKLRLEIRSTFANQNTIRD